MNYPAVLIIGAICGALDGAGIYFAPQEPYKNEIMMAATLRGVLVSLLTGYSLAGHSTWLRGLGWGVLYGLATALVVWLAKGGLKSSAAPYVLPAGVVMGAINGLLLVKFVR